jgi:hypothetical protein
MARVKLHIEYRWHVEMGAWRALRKVHFDARPDFILALETAQLKENLLRVNFLVCRLLG